MNQKEMIEEMAKIALKNTMSYTCAKQIAMNFYEQGYRKIPEGSVVLSKEEYERLPIFQFETAQQIMNEARKETAKEIFVALINALLIRKERAKKFYSIKESVGVDMAIDTAKKLAKQYGVVEE